MKLTLYNTLEKLDFFKHLNHEDLNLLAINADILNFEKDEILFYEKERKYKIYCLLEGELKFYKVDRFDNEIFMYYLIDFGMVTDFIDMSELTLKECFANAVFSKKSKMLSINFEVFKQLLKKDLNLYQNFIKECRKRLDRLESVIKRDVVFDGTAKAAFMIVNSLKYFNSLKKHEIAYELHMQPETLSRILAKMVRNNLIKIEKNRLKVLNERALKEIYEQG